MQEGLDRVSLMLSCVPRQRGLIKTYFSVSDSDPSTYSLILRAIYSFDKYLLSTYYEPGTTLNSGNTAGRKAENAPLTELKFSLGRVTQTISKEYSKILDSGKY